MSAPRRVPLSLALALAVYFALRALILVSNFDEVAMPQFELFPMGTIPLIRDVEGGLPIERVYDNAAGQLLTGWLAVPCYALFGPTYLALKMVPLLLGAAALVFVWRLLRRPAGAAGATLGAILFALGPTTLTKYSLMASGNHFETIAFTALALWLFWRMHEFGVTPARLFGAAVACGFSIFVFLGALTPVLLLVLVHSGMRGPRAALRDAGWLAGGFAVGVAPLVVLNLMTGNRGLAFLDQKFSGGGSGFDFARFAQRLGEFFEHLPAASQYHDFAGIPGEFARWAFFVAFAAAYVVLAPSAWRGLRALASRAFGRSAPLTNDDALAAALLAYLPITALAFASSSLEVVPKPPPMDAEGYRYFNTHFLFAVLIVALAAARLRERFAAAGIALLAPALAAGAFDLALVDWSFARPNLGAYYDGFNLKQTANQLLTPRNGYSASEVVRMVGCYPREQRGWLYLGLGRVRAGQQFVKSRGGALELWNALDEFPAEHRDDVARGFGAFFRHLGRMQGRLDARFAALLESGLAANQPHAPAAIEGLATDWEVHLVRDLERDLREQAELLNTLAAPMRAHFARGWGAVCGRTLHRGIPWEQERVREAIDGVPAEFRVEFLEGVGAGWAESLRAPRGEGGLAQRLPSGADLEAVERGRARRAKELGL